MNNTLRFFFSIYLFMFFTISVAMQPANMSNQDVKSLNNPHSVYYLTNDSVLLNNPTGVFIRNLSLSGEKKLDTIFNVSNFFSSDNTFIQHNGEKIFVANGSNLMIIDRTKVTYDRFKFLPITSLKIGLSNTLWLTIDSSQYNYLVSYDYATEQFKEKKGIKCTEILDIDEEKQMVWIQDLDENISLYDLDTCQKYNTIIMPNNQKIKKLNNQFSFDKCYLAGGDALSIYKAIIRKATCDPFIQASSDEQFKRMAFVPHKNILAVVSQFSDTKSILRYWDFTQKQAKCPLATEQIDAIDCRDISFTPNGLEVIIAFRDKCIIDPVLLF